MDRSKPPKNNGVKSALALTGIAFQMGVIIYLAVQGGKWLDTQYPNEKQVFTIIATLLGVALSLWVVLQQLKHIDY